MGGDLSKNIYKKEKNKKKKNQVTKESYEKEMTDCFKNHPQIISFHKVKYKGLI